MLKDTIIAEMKIALLTIWREKNYGAELQAYATIKILQQLGHEVEMIDIRLSDCAHLNWKGHIGRFISQLGPSHKKFCEFWGKHIPTTKRYKTLKEIQAHPPTADIYIVGSDQVWNPKLTKEFATLYFLNFGNDNVKRISYASSFGMDTWNFPHLQEEIKCLLDKFDCVTCREDSGVKILKEEFGVIADHVIDPTLLLENYSELIGETRERNTLVYYPLTVDPELEAYSLKIAKQLNLEPVNNKHCTTLFGFAEWNRVSISEWVKNIAEARFVITRSFHGMVFSILYKRQFAVLAGSHGRNTRLTSLLKILGIEDRFFNSIEDMNNAKPWTKEIDYMIVYPKLLKIREESIDVLKNGIGL